MKGFRTLAFNIAAVIAPALLLTVTTQLETIDWTQYLSPTWAPVVMAGVGAVNIYLRFKTTTAVGKKK